MYRVDWIEDLKLRTAKLPTAAQFWGGNIVAWRLGVTSLLTDISSEIVTSILPAYLVLHLHAGPMAFGAIDGLYHGMAVAILSLGGGILADRWLRYKELALVGYGVSALCKLALLLIGSSVQWLGIVTAIDRAGKGIRAAPRDALLSLHSTPDTLTMSFAIHRALDAGGTLIGPLIAFALISSLHRPYEALWLTSFAFAVVGFAVLWLFVDNPKRESVSKRLSLPAIRRDSPFGKILIVGAALATLTVSDGFIYLLLQTASGSSAKFFPLYYVITATSYMILSIPIGALAMRLGRLPVLVSGYLVLLSIYAIIASNLFRTHAMPIAVLLLLGLYYAASEGVLMALASSVIPGFQRTGGLALLITAIGVGKMVASLTFGWLWEAHGSEIALICFGTAMGIAIPICAMLLRSVDKEPTGAA